MYPVSTQYLETIPTPHSVTTQIRVTKGGQPVHANLPFTDGTVTVDFASPVRRKLTLTLPPIVQGADYTDHDLRDLVGTSGHQVHVRQGLVFPDKTIEWVPLGVFRVDEVPDVSATGAEVTITGASREAFVVDDTFLYPRTIQGPSAIALISTLVRETLPQAEISVETRKNARVPAFVEDRDRWGAIEKIAQAISCVVYCDGEGRFIITDAPSLTSSPVWTIKAGPGGTLTDGASSQSREGVTNAIVVQSGSPSSDYIPLWDAVYDTDPTSLTRWGDPDAGAYGKITEYIDNPTITTLAQARAVGQTELAKRVGISAGMDLSTIPNPALEAGDTVLVVPDLTPAAANARQHIIDSLSIPLRAGGAFTLRTRDVRANV
ncbi:DUF5047 domain-containing protein [Populibacterium corticicola]|uniref:DUF5047 domain-containing protein n=1 Tax=Populibacterium corticicola TaxID=1812826 RepID=A0ABW5XAI4_9MICO